MVLRLDSDTAYLTILEARSCYYVHFYLSDWPLPRSVKPTNKRNGPIHTDYKTICNVVSSAADYETCGTFNNAKTAIGMRPDLITLDHK